MNMLGRSKNKNANTILCILTEAHPFYFTGKMNGLFNHKIKYEMTITSIDAMFQTMSSWATFVVRHPFILSMRTPQKLAH